MCITIEKALPTDAASLLAYLKQIGGETDNLTFGSEGLPFTTEAEAAFLTGLEKSRDGIMLVAKADGKIIGNASLSRLPRRMAHRGDLAVSVAKEYWNKGIGTELLKHTLSFARENGFEVLDLQVRSDNLTAIHVYEKLGFQKLCTYPKFFKIGDQYVDFEYMYLVL